jgi:HEAT repeat protein
MLDRLKTAALAAALLGATVTPVAAQAAPLQDAQPSHTDPEERFLRAYYREQALKDHEAAERMYRTLVVSAPKDRKLLASARLGLARCLAALGRVDEARGLVNQVATQYPDHPDLKRSKAVLVARSGASEEDDLEVLVRAALFQKGPTEVQLFGERAVPVLAELLRAADPGTVKRSAEALYVIGGKKAHAALAEALVDERVLYPQHLLNYPYIPSWAPVLEAAARSGDATMRGIGISGALARPGTPDWVVSMVVSDAQLRAKYMPSKGEAGCAEAWSKLVMAGLSSGDPNARTDALAALDSVRSASKHHPNDKGVDVLYDPPAEVLADDEAVAALGNAFGAVGIPRSLKGARPSPALVSALLKHTRGTYVVAHWALWDRATPDADEFTEALARMKYFPFPGYDTARVVSTLDRTLGEQPRAEHLRRLATGGIEVEDLAAYATFLAEKGRLDEARLRALLDGAKGKPELELQFVRVLGSRMEDETAATVPDWYEGALAHALESEDPRVREAAASALGWLAKHAGVDIAEHAPRIATLFEAPPRQANFPRTASQVLQLIGEPAVPELVRRLRPDQPYLEWVLKTVSELRAEAAVPVLRKLIADPTPMDDRTEIAWVLMVLEGEKATDALRKGLQAEDGAHAQAILYQLFDTEPPFPERMIVELFQFALESRLPGIPWNKCSPDDWRSPASVTPLIRAALQSDDVEGRRWSATTAGQLRLAAVWDELMAAAEDVDPESRFEARKALQAIRDSDAELESLRAAGEQMAARKQAQEMIASEDENVRRTGIALAVAVGMPGAVEALTRLATEDPVADVRKDARSALLAIGQVRRGPPAPAPK